jgi:GT2 family glycosyltransferase
MTATYQIPPSHSSKATFRSKPVDPRDIHVVIPTYNDWEGLRKTLDSLLKLKPSAKQITVVDDNQFKHPQPWLKDYPVKLAEAYEGNRGPAYARNIGFGFPAPQHGLFTPVQGAPNFNRLHRREWCDDPRLEHDKIKPKEFLWRHDIDWFYFTDCGCEHASDIFLQFENAWKETGDSCIAISGPITGDGDGLINKFMTEQGVLNPPKQKLIYDRMIPQAIVTANALVAGIALSFVGGFDETFTEAAGEDLDLGLRLRRLGLIGWAEKAVVKHRFAEDRNDFERRFKRYGAGNRRLEVKHNLPSLRARKFVAESPALQELADLEIEAMQIGYDDAVDKKARGKIVICEATD